MTQFQTIQISKLSKSPLNVRRTVRKGDVEELKASIVAHGVLHNLVVVADADGSYRVTDGARRLEALQALQADGVLPADYAVPCQIGAAEHAVEASLAANTVRLAMHPADEFEAFARLASNGMTPERIAERFGTDLKHVSQRLKLGHVDRHLLKEYRAGTLTLDCLMAFALTDDRKQQMTIYRSLHATSSLTPRAIRSALTETMAEADGKLARFVGLDAYRAAGGTLQSDLFSEAVYCENPALLNELAAGKLAVIRQRLESQGWGWVEISPDTDWQLLNHCSRIEPTASEVPAALRKERQAVLAELDDLAEAGEMMDDSDGQLIRQHDAAAARLAELDEAIAACVSFDAGHMKIAGCHVSLHGDGSLRIERGLLRKRDARQYAELTGVSCPSQPKAMPDALRRELEAFRLQIAQVAIAQHRQIAFDLLIFTAVKHIRHRGVCQQNAIDVRFVPHRPNLKEPTAADALWKDIEGALPLAWLECRSEGEQFQAFSTLAETQKLDLLAWCVASSLTPQLAASGHETAYDAALALTGIDVAAYWRPTAGNYLGRISRDQLLTLGRAMLGEAWAASRQRDKKSELTAQLERAFAEPQKAGRSPSQAESLTTWLPDGMAFTMANATKPAARKTAEKAA